MFTFNENQTEAQVDAAITVGVFTFADFAVVAPDTHYPNGSITVLLRTATDEGVGYRFSPAGVTTVAGLKTHVHSMITQYASLATAFNKAVVDDGQGIQYTLAEVQTW